MKIKVAVAIGVEEVIECDNWTLSDTLRLQKGEDTIAVFTHFMYFTKID